MSDRAKLSRPAWTRGPGASWVRAHRLELALALPLVTYLLVLTAAPIVETVRLSFSAPADGGFPSLGRYRFLLTSDVFRRALRNTESLIAKYDTQVDHLISETAWLAPNWPFTSGILARQGLLDRFEVYEGWRGPVRAVHVVGGDVLGIPRGVTGPRRERAVRLATFLMSRDAQERLVEGNAWPAIRADAYGRVPAVQRETFEAVRRALADGWHRPGVPYWPDVSDAMNEAVRRIVQGGEPVRPVLDRLHGVIAEAARQKGAPYPPPR